MKEGNNLKNLVSVITTVKNGENTIEQTINSVLKQTHKYTEYIIIDDGSTDGTHTILDYYVKKDNRVKIYKTGGIGRPQALNKGISVAEGKYIAIIDADDLFHPQKIEIQLEVFEKNPSFFLVGTKAEILYNNNDLLWKDALIEDAYEINEITSKILIRNSINHSSVMMNKILLKKIGMYNEQLKTQVDYELWLRAYNNNLKIVNVGLPLAAKRIHKNQSYENKKRFKYITNATKLQVSNIFKNKPYWYYLPIPILKFGLSFLPMKVRRKLASLI